MLGVIIPIAFIFWSKKITQSRYGAKAQRIQLDRFIYANGIKELRMHN
jgi:hypothetical protein